MVLCLPHLVNVRTAVAAKQLFISCLPRAELGAAGVQPLRKQLVVKLVHARWVLQVACTQQQQQLRGLARVQRWWCPAPAGPCRPTLLHVQLLHGPIENEPACCGASGELLLHDAGNFMLQAEGQYWRAAAARLKSCQSDSVCQPRRRNGAPNRSSCCS